MKKCALLGKLTMALLVLPFLATPAPAALLYYADFESYADGDPLDIGTSFDGADDTFTTKTTNGTFAAQNGGNPFSTGNYAEMAAPAAGSVTLRQMELGTYGTGGEVRIVSLDMALSADSAGSLGYTSSFLNSSNTSIASFSAITLSTTAPLRVTAVYNQSASAIVLPGSLGSVGTGQAALYFKDEAGTYTLAGSIVAAGTTGAGFGLGWTSVAAGDAAVFDNVGIWTSASDTVGSTSVLELSVGSVPVPEPSAALLLGSAGAALLIGRRRRKQS